MKMLVMAAKGNSHPDPGALESYSLGELSGEHTEDIEQHLLVCEFCRRQVSESEVFARSMQRASVQLRARQESQRSARVFPWFAPACAAALVVIAFGLAWWIRSPNGSATPVAVALVATRSSATATAPAGRPLLLQPNLEGLPALPLYRLAMVDSVGREQWTGSVEPSAAKSSPAVPARQPGLYFVRVYGPSRELLREYGLEIRTPGDSTARP